MKKINSFGMLSNIQKEKYIDRMTEELLTLRGKAGFTQDELAGLIGISRQTYYAMENKIRKMSWNTYLSLIYIYSCVPNTRGLLKKLDVLPTVLLEVLINKD